MFLSTLASRSKTTRRWGAPIVLVAAVVAGLLAVVVGPAPSADAQTPPVAGVYVPLPPARILDTRVVGSGGPIGATTTRDVQVTGQGGVPTSDVLAVVVDLTAVNNTAQGWGLLWQTGTPRPGPASSVDYVPGRAVTNKATTKVSSAGKVSYYSLVSTDLVVDVVGYYRHSPGAGGYVPVTQTRVFDSRDSAKISAGAAFDRKLRGVAGVPDTTAVTAVAVNLSTFNEEAAGYATVWAKGDARPGTAAVTYATGRMQTQLVLATLSGDGWASVYTSARTDMVMDVVGYYTAGAGARFVPLAPTRIVDTRYHVPGWGTGPLTQPLAPNTNTAVQLTGLAGVPATGVSTVVLTAVADTRNSTVGFLNFYASGDPQPSTISLTYYPGEDTAAQVMAKVGPDGKTIVTNYTGTTDLVIDVVGYMSTDLGPSGPQNLMATPGPQSRNSQDLWINFPA